MALPVPPDPTGERKQMTRSILHIGEWIDAFILLGWIAAGSLAVLYASFLLLRLMHERAAGDPASVPVASYFGAITPIWALIFGFVAAEVWSTNSNAGVAAVEERSALIRLHGMAVPDALALENLESALRLYSAEVVHSEWNTNGNRSPAPQAEEALQEIRLAMLAADRRGVSPVLMAKMVADFDELQDARTKRLAIGARDMQPLKWALVVVLGMMSMVSIAFVHRDKPRAGRTALKIFAVAAAAAIWLVLLHSSPYLGPVRVDSTALLF